MTENAGAVGNSAFSKITPKLQLAWDSTSLGLLKECPRKYYYSIVEGWTGRGSNVHLVFGQYYHKALERYDHSRSEGKDHERSLHDAVRQVLSDTWDKQRKRPWVSDDKIKNRWTLLRTVVWYLEQFGQDDPCKTIQLSNGKPAVEVSFRFETDFKSMNDEPFLLCGHLDRVVDFNGEAFILDRKTSKNQLDDEFYLKYCPENQMSLYSLAGQVALHVETKGVIIDGAQIGVTFSRFKRGPTYRTEHQLVEFYADTGFWIGQAEIFAQKNYWPMNDKSCTHYGGCPFQEVCRKSPIHRESWLKGAFVKRQWDPLEVRGDI